MLLLEAQIGDILDSRKEYLEVVYHHLGILALGSRTRDELRSRTLAGRLRDDTLDSWFDDRTCQRMIVEEDNSQRLTYTGNLGLMMCGIVLFYLKPTRTAVRLPIEGQQP